MCFFCIQLVSLDLIICTGIAQFALVIYFEVNKPETHSDAIYFEKLPLGIIEGGTGCKAI